jgi:nitrogen fixation protein NifB
MSETISHKPAKHFCASDRRSSGRVHLPVAPKALARVRFSPETPLPRALTPERALNWLDYMASEGEAIQVVNLNGPGDPLASPDLTLQTLAALRESYPGLSLCLTTLGLGAAELAAQLAEFGLAHVSILMDAVDPKVAEGIYAWIRPGTKTLPLPEAARLLVEEQAGGIKALVNSGVKVQAKTTVYPGINSEHISEIAEKSSKLGISSMKLFPFLAKDDDHPRPAWEAVPEELSRAARQASKHLPTQLVDLAYCRETVEFNFSEPDASQKALPKPDGKKPYLAICSSDGFEVDLHLGQTGQFIIYGPKDGPVLLMETRPAPEPGNGDTRWQQAALTLSDCFAVLCAAAGEAPKRVLAERGITVLEQEGNVEGLVDILYGGGKKNGRKK